MPTGTQFASRFELCFGGIESGFLRERSFDTDGFFAFGHRHLDAIFDVCQVAIGDVCLHEIDALFEPGLFGFERIHFEGEILDFGFGFLLTALRIAHFGLGLCRGVLALPERGISASLGLFAILPCVDSFFGQIGACLIGFGRSDVDRSRFVAIAQLLELYELGGFFLRTASHRSRRHKAQKHHCHYAFHGYVSQMSFIR